MTPDKAEVVKKLNAKLSAYLEENEELNMGPFYDLFEEGILANLGPNSKFTTIEDLNPYGKTDVVSLEHKEG